MDCKKWLFEGVKTELGHVAAQRHAPESLGSIFQNRVEKAARILKVGQNGRFTRVSDFSGETDADRNRELRIELKSNDCFRSKQIVGVAQKHRTECCRKRLRGDA